MSFQADGAFDREPTTSFAVPAATLYLSPGNSKREEATQLRLRARGEPEESGASRRAERALPKIPPLNLLSWRSLWL
jgi:hypothetical protein